MNALSLPSSAVTRSRKARTTSTGETSLVWIMRESSVTERQTRSGISEHPVLRGRLDVRERYLLQARQELERPRHRRPDRLELGVAPVEPGEPAHALEGVQAYFHGREPTTRMRGHGRPPDHPEPSPRPRAPTHALAAARDVDSEGGTPGRHRHHRHVRGAGPAASPPSRVSH